MNDYIIMREGIEPIWEDPRNKNGGTFSVKIGHKKGYENWSMFMTHILGETLMQDMSNINGISMSYISSDDDMGPTVAEGTISSVGSAPSPSFADRGSTFLKIWDGKPDQAWVNP